MKIENKEIKADEGKWVARKSHCKYYEDYFPISTILPNETLEDFIEVDTRPSEDVRLLDEAKEAKIAELNDYNMSEAVNTFSIMGEKQKWLNPNERVVARDTCNALQRKGEMQAPFGDTMVPITFALDCLDSLNIYAMETMQTEKIHRENIDALTTIEQVEAYDYKIGWPTPPSF